MKRLKSVLKLAIGPAKGAIPLAPRQSMTRCAKADQGAAGAPDKRWLESDIKAHGFDPSTVRRSFKRNYRITFLERGQQLRLREGFSTLSIGERVIDAQIDASFESGSAFSQGVSKKIWGKPHHADEGCADVAGLD